MLRLRDGPSAEYWKGFFAGLPAQFLLSNVGVECPHGCSCFTFCDDNHISPPSPPSKPSMLSPFKSVTFFLELLLQTCVFLEKCSLPGLYEVTSLCVFTADR